MISIITVTFNAASTLKGTLDSIVAQKFDDYEIVAIDGGSKDGTVEIFKQYSQHLGTLISEPDKGVYDAMNKGVRAAKGDILFFLNAQDTFYSPDVLEKVNDAFMSAEKPYIVFGDIYFSNNSNIPASQLTVPSGITRSYRDNGFNDPGICHQCIFYRKELFEILGGYDLNYSIYADYDFNIRAFSYSFNRYKYIPLTIAAFDLGGISTKKDAERLQQMNLENMQLRKKAEVEKQKAIRKHFLYSRGKGICEGGYFMQIMGVRLDWTELKRYFCLLPQPFPFSYSMSDGNPRDLHLSAFECPVNGVSWADNVTPSVTFKQGKEKLPEKIKIYCQVAVCFSCAMKNIKVIMLLDDKEVDYKEFSSSGPAEYRDRPLSGEVDGGELTPGNHRISFKICNNEGKVDLEKIHFGLQKVGTTVIDTPYEIRCGEKLIFRDGENGMLTMYKRAYPPDDWGCWIAPDSILRFKLPQTEKNTDLKFVFSFHTLFCKDVTTRNIKIMFGEKKIGTHTINQSDKLPSVCSYTVDRSLLPADGIIELRLQTDRYFTPALELPNNPDCRKLGVGLYDLLVEETVE